MSGEEEKPKSRFETYPYYLKEPFEEYAANFDKIEGRFKDMEAIIKMTVQQLKRLSDKVDVPLPAPTPAPAEPVEEEEEDEEMEEPVAPVAPKVQSKKGKEKSTA